MSCDDQERQQRRGVVIVIKQQRPFWGYHLVPKYHIGTQNRAFVDGPQLLCLWTCLHSDDLRRERAGILQVVPLGDVGPRGQT